MTTMRAASETLIGRKKVPAVIRGFAAIFSRLLWAKLHQERAAQLEGEVQRLRAKLATAEEEARCRLDDVSAELGFARREADKTIARIVAQRDEARAALADKALILQEVARLRDQTTPRTYREGDPCPIGRVLWWRGGRHGWVWMPTGHYLDPGDIWLPPPPSPSDLVSLGTAPGIDLPEVPPLPEGTEP